MKNKIRLIIFLMVAASLAVGFLCLRESKTKIIGRWYKDDDIYIEFFESGIWECAEEFEGYGGIWRLSGNKVYMTDLLGNDYTGILQSDNNSLTLNGDIYKKILENSYNFFKPVDES